MTDTIPINAVKQNLTSKQCILYARVSTTEQAEKGFSLQSQIEAMREYATRDGFEVIREFQEDYTGTSLSRPKLDQARAMLAAHEASTLSRLIFQVTKTGLF